MRMLCESIFILAFPLHAYPALSIRFAKYTDAKQGESAESEWEKQEKYRESHYGVATKKCMCLNSILNDMHVNHLQ